MANPKRKIKLNKSYNFTVSVCLLWKLMKKNIPKKKRELTLPITPFLFNPLLEVKKQDPTKPITLLGKKY